MKPADVRIVFMGSPAFAVPSLRALSEAGYHVTAAVTQPDRPAGRGGRVHAPEVKAAALALGIPVHQPESLREPAAVNLLASLAPDLIVVAAYGKILPRAVLSLPRRGALNVHASLLPRWRGASPIAAAIRHGDRETGVTIMEMVQRMDAGPVVASHGLAIGADDTTGSLEPRLAQEGARLLIEALPGWLEGSIVARPQVEEHATYCRVLRKEDGHLAASLTAEEAERAVRADNPWPGAFVIYRGVRLGTWRARPVPGLATPGTLTVVGREPAVAFREGLLVLEEVQLPGGKRIPGAAFVNGERGRLEPQVELS